MAKTSKDYREEARGDAWETAEHFVDEMVERWKRDGAVSNDLNNDYNGDEYHHAYHVDRDYDLTEAAALLDQLHEYEETDNGLWDGLEPRRAIAAQAAYTYGNAVYDLWRSLVVDELNSVLEDLDDNLPADADDDTRANAGEHIIRFFVIVKDDIDHGDGEEGQFVRSAWEGLKNGDATAAGALADWYAEHGEESKGKEIRRAVGIAS